MKLRRPENKATLSANTTAHKSSGLNAGDLVRIRSYEEIEKTLGTQGELHGCLYMSEMHAYCGTIQRVLKPVARYIDESDYKVRECSGVVILKNVMCQGSEYPEGCDCSCHFFWREEWLEKIPETPTT